VSPLTTRICASAPSSSPGGIDGRVASPSGILQVQSSSVAGKTAVVEPPESDPNNLPNRDPLGDDKPGHTNGLYQEDNRCLRSALENSSEIMKVVDLYGTQRSRAWRSP
jgi:hypothetical protein